MDRIWEVMYEADCSARSLIEGLRKEYIPKYIKELKIELKKAIALYLPIFKEEPLYESTVELLKQIEEKKYS